MDSSNLQSSRANDRDRFRLRRFLEKLVEAGLCEVREKPIKFFKITGVP